jgi:hypothetical protein
MLLVRIRQWMLATILDTVRAVKAAVIAVTAIIHAPNVVPLFKAWSLHPWH